MKKKMQKIFKKCLPVILSVVMFCMNCVPVFASETVGGSQTSGNESETNKGDSTLNKITIYQIEYKSTGYVCIDVYEYSGSSDLLLVHQKGTAYNQYIGNMDSGASYLYIENSAGVVTAPTVTYVTKYTFSPSTGTVSETVQGTEKILTSLSYFPQTNTSKCFGWYIDGDYTALAYTPSKYDADNNGNPTETITFLDVASYWFSTGGNVIRGWRAFEFDIHSRSALNSFYGYTKSGTFALSNAKLSDDGVFSYEGLSLGYTSDNVWRGGISMEFYYTRDNSTSWQTSLYYYYQLPLEGGQYEFNFADIEHIKMGGYDYTLSQLRVTPVLQINWYDMQTGRTAITYSHEQLSTAGCFEDGGNPIAYVGTVDKGDSATGKPSGDPSLGGGSDSGSNIGGSIEEPAIDEWDSSEHGFWENVIHYLSNMANNLFTLGATVITFPAQLVKLITNGESVLDILKDVFEKVKELVETVLLFPVVIVENITTMIMDLILPSEDYFPKKFEEMKAQFPIVDDFYNIISHLYHYLGEAHTSIGVPTITVPLASSYGEYGVEDYVISFEWFLPYRQTCLDLMSAFILIKFAVWQFFSLKSIFNGTSGVAETVTDIKND